MARPRWLTIGFATSAIIALACCALGYFQYKTQQTLKDLQWINAVASHTEDQNTMTLELGVIQFLKNGFSVKLDSAEATATGVTLVGEFGNPKAMSLSSVTLEFAVEKPMWHFRKQWEHDPFLFWAEDSLTVGKAQVSVGDVPVGGTTHFRVVVPNVKGDLKSYSTVVRLSGERYQYIR